MKIVTGVLHAGKTTMLESSGQMFVRWDDWFPLYIEADKGKQSIADIVPSEYLEHPSIARKLLAITPDMLEKVCKAVSDEFRNFAEFAEFAEVPVYAVNAVRRDGDTVIIVSAPNYDELLRRIMQIRKCDSDKASRIIIKEAAELDAITWDHYISNANELIFASSVRRLS
jgi:dephospho-CoA kinase